MEELLKGVDYGRIKNSRFCIEACAQLKTGYFSDSANIKGIIQKEIPTDRSTSITTILKYLTNGTT